MNIRYLILAAAALVVLVIIITFINIKHTELTRGRILIWIEPWMPNTTIPRWALAGIVTVYYCGTDVMCLETLNNSLALIKYYLNISQPVFIALYPTYWTYRGRLNNPVYFNYSYLTRIVNYLKVIDPSGKGLMIGFSEQWGCLQSLNCEVALVNTYHMLEREFPEAGFYYYDCCIDVNTMINFAKEANVTILGYDIYSYVHKGNMVYVNPSLLSNLRIVKQHGFTLIVGEIGFRVCDANAWYNPSQANPGILIKYNCTAPALYLAEVLNQVSELEPAYIGIWAWDDCCGFGVSQNPLMINVLRDYVENTTYYPLTS
ncbi:hypothetical protein [Caldivirga sp.]|uniref:hypothetical protein n=1 Tax=Caldivirga sp. TaxID=2080243 RepID=UPI003D0F575E